MPAINYIKGNLFTTARPAVLAHACNTHGVWGGGIAYQFAKLFPIAEATYEQHCAENKPSELLGTALLIHTDEAERGNNDETPHFVACLFTSVGGGGDADSVADIVKNTRNALADLERQLKETDMEELLEVRQRCGGKWVIDMPKINAGIFRVPWEDTEAVLEKSELEYNVYVVD